MHIYVCILLILTCLFAYYHSVILDIVGGGGRICDCFKGIRKDTSFMHSEVQISILYSHL